MSEHVQSPGIRCPVRDGSFWCSRDEGHPDAHTSRSDDGPGSVSWRNLEPGGRPPYDPDPLTPDPWFGIDLPPEDRPSTPLTFAWIVAAGLLCICVGLGLVVWFTR